MKYLKEIHWDGHEILLFFDIKQLFEKYEIEKPLNPLEEINTLKINESEEDGEEIYFLCLVLSYFYINPKLKEITLKWIYRFFSGIIIHIEGIHTHADQSLQKEANDLVETCDIVFSFLKPTNKEFDKKRRLHCKRFL